MKHKNNVEERKTDEKIKRKGSICHVQAISGGR